MRILKLSEKGEKEAIKIAIDILEKGGLVIYPTETCYGVGVDATNQQAVDKLLKYKKKREGKAISVAVTGKKMAKEYVEINEIAENIYDNYLPGPITVVSKGKNRVADKIQSDDGTLGIRIPAYPLVLELVKAFGKPITATSANQAYKKTPYSIDDILGNLSERQRNLIDLIIDAGTLPRNRPSTVINTTLNEMQILREGDVILKAPKKIISKSEEDTQGFASRLMGESKGFGRKPIIFALQGELGTGKTQFTKGLARHLGIKEIVLSPTFILVREYPFSIKEDKVKLYHIDAYRLFEEREFMDLGFKEMLKQPNIIAVEWAEKVSKPLREAKKQAELVWIKLKYNGEKIREIEYSWDIL